MNKRGNQLYVAIAILAILVLAFGSYVGIDLFGEKNDYIVDLEVTPDFVQARQSLELSASLFNPGEQSFNAEIEIEFNESLWTTNNYYINSGQKANIGRINKKDVEKYSVRFTPTYEFNENPTTSKFKVILYDSSGNKIEERTIYAKAKE